MMTVNRRNSSWNLSHGLCQLLKFANYQTMLIEMSFSNTSTSVRRSENQFDTQRTSRLIQITLQATCYSLRQQQHRSKPTLCFSTLFIVQKIRRCLYSLATYCYTIDSGVLCHNNVITGAEKKKHLIIGRVTITSVDVVNILASNSCLYFALTFRTTMKNHVFKSC